MARIRAINILVFEIYGSLVHKLKQAAFASLSLASLRSHLYSQPPYICTPPPASTYLCSLSRSKDDRRPLTYLSKYTILCKVS
jgi:hypothetical protein